MHNLKLSYEVYTNYKYICTEGSRGDYYLPTLESWYEFVPTISLPRGETYQGKLCVL